MTSFFDLIFPKKCLGCSRTGAYFCPSCQKEIKVWPIQICPVCNRSAIHGLTHPKCQKRTSPDGLISIFVYQGLIKEAIKKLKYRPWRYHLAEELINLTLKQLSREIPTESRGSSTQSVGTIELLNHYLLIPIPLHWFRQNWRGFNQSVILGKKLAEKLKIKFIPDLLYRSRFTRPQTGLKAKARKANIQAAFNLHPKYPPNILVSQSRQTRSQYPNILLFDDVWTTGATMRECSRVLKKAGVKKVWCFTLAR